MPQYNRAELGRMSRDSGFVRDTYEKVHTSIDLINDMINSIRCAQKELSDAAANVNLNLQHITYSSDNLSNETKDVLDSVNSLQVTMQNFQV